MVEPLTKREEQVVEVIRSGASTYQGIARALQPPVSPRTAETFVTSIAKKVAPDTDGGPIMRVIRWAIVSEALPDEEPPEPVPTGKFLYIIRAERSGLLKIGVSSTPEVRLLALQTGSPEPLNLLGYVPADRDTEADLHTAFAGQRRHGEWFEPSPDLLAAVDKILGAQGIARTGKSE